jgi:signal peptidase I
MEEGTATMPETDEVKETGAAERPARREETSLREYAESLLVTVILALFGTTFIVQAFKIPSASMEPTLLVGDHVLVNKFIFEGRGQWYARFLPYRDIRRGDIIVFHYPFDDHPHYVKRVIGIPGDHIKIVDEEVYINGVALNEPYAVHTRDAAFEQFGLNYPPTDASGLDPTMRPEWAADILNHVQDGELVVPPGKYFAMGDNRDDSADSRYWGFVDREAIMGRPVIIYWSVNEAETESGDEGLGGQMYDLIDSLLHIFSRTRGGRMFHEVH